VSRDPSCIFCKIVAVQVPAAVVYEDEDVLAFLDVGPLAEGHLLVIPRDHHDRLTDLTPEKCSKLAAVLPTLGRALLAVSGAPGFNVLVNQGSVAGQVVPLVHFHLIPRNAGDQLGYRWNAGKYAPGRAVELAAAIQAALSHHS
jgi:histidine triad (HIT) family protein